MLIKVYKDLENFEEFNLVVDNMKDVLSGLKMIKGEEFTNNIISNTYSYVVISNNPNIGSIYLNENTFLFTLSDYDLLIIAPEIEGQAPIMPFIMAAMAAAESAAVAAGAAIEAGVVAAGSEIGLSAGASMFIAKTLVLIGASIALNGIMQALSPTTSFSTDPSLAQKKSNLFNGAPMITEQGGSVPLWYGKSYAGGVLISSGVSTAEG